jgi:hypothetical protein
MQAPTKIAAQGACTQNQNMLHVVNFETKLSTVRYTTKFTKLEYA